MYGRNQIIMFMSNKIDIVMIKEYLTHILKLPLDFFITRKTGEILSRLNDVSMIRNLLSSTFVSVIIDIFMFLFGGIFMFTCGSKLILVAMLPVVISAIVSWIFIRPYKTKLKDKAFKATSVFVEKNFEGIEIDLTKKVIIVADDDGCKIQNV